MITDDEILLMRTFGVSESGAMELLDEVERLRAENALLSHHLTIAVSSEPHMKLAKAIAALRHAKSYLPPEGQEQIVQTLKEIQG